jgi:hypothetical protein
MATIGRVAVRWPPPVAGMINTVTGAREAAGGPSAAPVPTCPPSRCRAPATRRTSTPDARWCSWMATRGRPRPFHARPAPSGRPGVGGGDERSTCRALARAECQLIGLGERVAPGVGRCAACSARWLRYVRRDPLSGGGKRVIAGTTTRAAMKQRTPSTIARALPAPCPRAPKGTR